MASSRTNDKRDHEVGNSINSKANRSGIETPNLYHTDSENETTQLMEMPDSCSMP